MGHVNNKFWDLLDAWNSILSKKFYFNNILSRTLRPKEVSGSRLRNLGRKLNQTLTFFGSMSHKTGTAKKILEKLEIQTSTSFVKI